MSVHRKVLTSHRIVTGSLVAVVALLLALVGPPGLAAAGPPDPSRITATCSAGVNPNGPFSATAPIALLAGAPLVLRLGYRNGDQQADFVYFANFTATLSASAAFGPARTIDTSRHAGGGGLATGTSRNVFVPTGAASSGPEQIVVEITSDSATGVLARCAFSLVVRGINPDFDGDGLSNEIEINGLRDAAGNLVLTAAGRPAADLPALAANPCRKDLFVQIGFQPGAGHDHRPKQAALDQVVRAFGDAPVPGAPGACPFPGFTTASGIHLGFDIDDPLPAEASVIAPVNCGNIPLTRFDPTRRPYFLYSVWVHQSAANSQSGVGPCAGRSFVVSLGLWPDNGTVPVQAGTFMHELGHVLGLGHGGNDPVNLKPNYLSVMNYSFQTGIPNAAGAVVPDYSRSALPTLDEAILSESTGVAGQPDRQTRWWGPQPAFRYPDASSPFRPANAGLDWNQNNLIDQGTVGVDVNSDGQCTTAGLNGLRDTTPAVDDIVSGNEVWNGTNRICDSRPGGDDVLSPQPNASLCVLPGPDGTLQSTRGGDDVVTSGVITIGPNVVCNTTAVADDVQFVSPGRTESRLFGFDDWSAIDWRIGPTRTQPGATQPLPPVEPHGEPTVEEAAASSSATRPSTDVDLEVRTAVDRTDALPGDTLTFAATVTDVGTGPATGVRLVGTRPDGSTVTLPVPDLAPGASATVVFAYTVPFPVADGLVLTGTATASVTAPERQTANNSASASATVRAAPCRASGMGGTGAARNLTFAVVPLSGSVVGAVSYVDVAAGTRDVVTSTQIDGVACFAGHARIFGRAAVQGGGAPVDFRLDVDDRGPGPGTDAWAIGWPGRFVSGVLTRGNIVVGP